MQVRSAPISSPMVIAMLLPLIMWAAAAGIAWFVVDRLLIRPLRDLQREVAEFTPGDELDPAATRGIPAQEIRDLGETFRAISRTVALHEAGLAEGLVRQTKLTREVHHRVKNNLQVIASLINLHSRAARTPEATEAYASIQRRVDALAVVHRNHYAELEENRGLSLRRMLGELASNLRATAPDDIQLGIVVDVEPLTVNQDIAVAVAFLVTEAIELAMMCDRAAKVRLSIKPTQEPNRATLRISSSALAGSDCYQAQFTARYGRVLEGLSRQLRGKLHHEPLVGAFEITIAVLGRE
jgi:two-component sensor histidine kinase